MNSALQIRHLGLSDYEPTWRAMQKFTDGRHSSTPDEIWSWNIRRSLPSASTPAASICCRRATFRWCRSTAAAR